MSTDREDLEIADDLEEAGRLDEARTLRAKHLSPTLILADDLRIRLGLRTWRSLRNCPDRAEAIAAALRDGYRHSDLSERRTGRTTRAALAVIAQAAIEKRRSITVVSNRSQWVVRDLVDALGLDVRTRIVPARDHWRGGALSFIDHLEVHR